MAVLLREAIGDRLRRTRTSQHRTLREVSRSARVSLGYLSEVERGRKEASSELLAAICDALSLPLADLLDSVAGDLRPRRLVERLDRRVEHVPGIGPIETVDGRDRIDGIERLDDLEALESLDSLDAFDPLDELDAIGAGPAGTDGGRSGAGESTADMLMARPLPHPITGGPANPTVKARTVVAA
ncbi:MAG TPA: helix-turn-helix transcriptional regulator [Pseudonocardiaceae bacterium]